MLCCRVRGKDKNAADEHFRLYTARGEVVVYVPWIVCFVFNLLRQICRKENLCNWQHSQEFLTSSSKCSLENCLFNGLFCFQPLCMHQYMNHFRYQILFTDGGWPVVSEDLSYQAGWDGRNWSSVRSSFAYVTASKSWGDKCASQCWILINIITK